MAKINPSLRAKRGSTKRIPTRVIVHRTAERGAGAFEACVRMGGRKLREGDAAECAFGKNPRKAIANAMTQLAKALRTRKGAFRGMR